MDINIATQIIGWAASLCAIFSYSRKSMRQVRLVNLCAATFFIIYGVLLTAPAIVVMNATLACVHIAYLTSNDKFGKVVSEHFKATMFVFCVYALISIIWVVYSTNADIAEVVGIISSVGFVGGFLIPREVPMRVTCSIALILNIVYAVLIGSPQVAVTNAVSLGVNIYRLVEIYRILRLLPGNGVEMTD